LEYWNVWGRDLAGRIESYGEKCFYLKDHLGNIRAIMGGAGSVYEAYDYDPWWHKIRGYNTAGESFSTRNKFTGKERDLESGYDYFGARYYDSRIANWGSVDPLFERHINWSPYNYVLRNSLVLFDPDGKQVFFSENQNARNEEVNNLKMMVGPDYDQQINVITNSNGEYILNASSIIDNGDDLNITALIFLAKGNNPIHISFKSIDEPFSDNQQLTFDQLEEVIKNDQNVIGGITIIDYYKMNLNPECPNLVSPTGKTEIYINRAYGVRHGVASLAHEIQHAYFYFRGDRWKDKNPEVNENAKKAEEKAYQNYDKLHSDDLEKINF
jgi:RHS repeat-associated protein